MCHVPESKVLIRSSWALEIQNIFFWFNFLKSVNDVCIYSLFVTVVALHGFTAWLTTAYTISLFYRLFQNYWHPWRTLLYIGIVCQISHKSVRPKCLLKNKISIRIWAVLKTCGLDTLKIHKLNNLIELERKSVQIFGTFEEKGSVLLFSTRKLSISTDKVFIKIKAEFHLGKMHSLNKRIEISFYIIQPHV